MSKGPRMGNLAVILRTGTEVNSTFGGIIRDIRDSAGLWVTSKYELPSSEYNSRG